MMAKEIKPQDIEDRFKEEESKIIEETILSSITIINNLLQNRYREILKKEFFKTTARELEWPTPSSRWGNLTYHLNMFYTSWDVTGDMGNNDYYILFHPKKKINQEVIIDISKLKEVQEEVSPDEVIENRADILDL